MCGVSQCVCVCVCVGGGGGGRELCMCCDQSLWAPLIIQLMYCHLLHCKDFMDTLSNVCGYLSCTFVLSVVVACSPSPTREIKI